MWMNNLKTTCFLHMDEIVKKNISRITSFVYLLVEMVFHMDEFFIMYSFASFCEIHIFQCIFSCALRLIKLFKIFFYKIKFSFLCTLIYMVCFLLNYYLVCHCVPRLWRQMPFCTLLTFWKNIHREHFSDQSKTKLSSFARTVFCFRESTFHNKTLFDKVLLWKKKLFLSNLNPSVQRNMLS